MNKAAEIKARHAARSAVREPVLAEIKATRIRITELYQGLLTVNGHPSVSRETDADIRKGFEEYEALKVHAAQLARSF